MEPEDARRIAVKVASETAAMLRDNACTPRMARVIRGETTRADQMAEEYAVEVLRAEGIKVRIIGEEGGVYGDGDIVALIDPLDGSVNYLNCIPWASVSIALAPGNARTFREILAGAIAPIFTGQPLSFSRGGGCRMGETLIRERMEPYKRVIAVYVEHPSALEGLKGFMSRFRGFKVRSLGSAALEIAYTAIGRITLFLDVRSKLRNVDTAAAAGMLLECGGSLIGADGVEPGLDLSGVSRIGSLIASLDHTLAEETYSIVGPQMRRPGSPPS